MWWRKLVFFGLEQAQFNYCSTIASLAARTTVLVVANCLIICLPCLTESWFLLIFILVSGTVADSLKPSTYSSLDFHSLSILFLFLFTSLSWSLFLFIGCFLCFFSDDFYEIVGKKSLNLIDFCTFSIRTINCSGLHIEALSCCTFYCCLSEFQCTYMHRQCSLREFAKCLWRREKKNHNNGELKRF